MRLFVTGATGFIGSNFLNRAFDEGFEVIALRRSIHSRPRVKLQKNPIWLTKQLSEVAVEDFLSVDVVVHLAAHSMTPPYAQLEECLHYNLITPLKLFKNAIKAGVNKFVVAGSCFEYGKSGEDYDFIPVDAPLKPTSTYAASKAAASTAFYQLAVQFDLQFSLHRIFHVYGPGEAQYRLWPSLRQAALQGKDFEMTRGEQIRDFIHVHEVVNTLLYYCTRKSLRAGEPCIENLGSGMPTSILDFSKMWWKSWNASGKLLVGSLPYRENEVMRYVPEIKLS